MPNFFRGSGVEPPPEMREKMERVMGEIQARVQKIEDEHGRHFSEGVNIMVSATQLAQLLAMCGAPETVMVIHANLLSNIVGAALRSLGVEDKLTEMNAIAESLCALMEPLNRQMDEKKPGTGPGRLH